MNEPPLTLARQPILTADGGVFGYELLYRGAALDGSVAATVKSARVLCEALSNPGLEGVVGDAYMFVNFDQDLLATDVPMLLHTGQGVVEVVEDVTPTADVIETLVKLRRGGIGIALDDFQFQEHAVPLLQYVDYVKVDIQASAHELGELVQRLNRYNLPLIAEKVETHEEVARCKALGFAYFQGYYFARPEPMRAQSVESTLVAIVSLIADLQNPDMDPSELAEKIGRDLGLAHRILKLSNSASYRRRRPVNSIQDAVILLGQQVIRQWASLLLMTRLATSKSPELFSVALIRGRLCQALGASNRQFDPSELYTVGLLSVLDALLDRPMKTLVTELPLASSLADALCGRPSGLGDVLQKAIAYETGDWATLGPLTPEQELQLPAAYADATQFARTTLRS